MLLCYLYDKLVLFASKTFLFPLMMYLAIYLAYLMIVSSYILILWQNTVYAQTLMLVYILS